MAELAAALGGDERSGALDGGALDYLGDDNGNSMAQQRGLFDGLFGALRPGGTYTVQVRCCTPGCIAAATRAAAPVLTSIALCLHSSCCSPSTPSHIACVHSCVRSCALCVLHVCVLRVCAARSLCACVRTCMRACVLLSPTPPTPRLVVNNARTGHGLIVRGRKGCR